MDDGGGFDLARLGRSLGDTDACNVSSCFRRITQDLLADSRSIQNTVAAEMDKAVSKYSTLQSELRIAKGLHDGYQRHRDHITYLIERKGKVRQNYKPCGPSVAMANRSS